MNHALNECAMVTTRITCLKLTAVDLRTKLDTNYSLCTVKALQYVGSMSCLLQTEAVSQPTKLGTACRGSISQCGLSALSVSFHFRYECLSDTVNRQPTTDNRQPTAENLQSSG